MDNEMIKRCVKELGNNLAANSKGECLLIATDKQVTEMVRVVIKAIRKPTEKMKIAGSVDPGSGGPDEGYETEVWQAMIDSILND